MTHIPARQPSLPGTAARPPGRIPRGYEEGVCRDCNARIFWATVVNWLGEVRRRSSDGRPVRRPVDPGPATHGHWRLVDGGRGRIRQIGREEAVDPEQRWHLHDCATTTP